MSNFQLTSSLSLAAALFLAGCPAPEPTEPETVPLDATVMLVHGTWHTGASWSVLEEELDARGIRHAKVELPTTDPEPGTAPGLTDDVVATQAAMADIEGPIIMLGHSYGGMVLSAAGLDDRVQHLVYACAYVPDPGQDLVTLAMNTTSAPTLLADALLFDEMTGMTSIDPTLAADVFYADLSAEDAAQAVAELVPSSGLASVEPIGSEVAWQGLDSTYIVCGQDNAIPPQHQREMGAHIGATVLEFETSHSVALADPEGLADVIEDILVEAGAQ